MKTRADSYDFGLRDVDVPQEPRPISEHRLLVYDAVCDTLSHSSMRALVQHLTTGDLLVFNDSRVVPVALYLPDGRFVLLIEPDRDSLSDVRVICPFKPRVGEIIGFPFADLALYEHEPGWDVYRASVTTHDGVSTLGELIRRHGQFPLPIYLRRQPTAADSRALQNYFAAVDGSIAPPVAGTHFDRELVEAAIVAGVEVAMVTLHVGYGTFRSFKAEFVEEHTMDRERYAVRRATVRRVNAALKGGKRVVAVGTTSARVLETLGMNWPAIVDDDRDIEGETDLFIKPPYEPRIVHGLITNFQYPMLPVIAMAATFVGLENLRRVYSEAHERKYKFYSLGDAMLLKF